MGIFTTAPRCNAVKHQSSVTVSIVPVITLKYPARLDLVKYCSQYLNLADRDINWNHGSVWCMFAENAYNYKQIATAIIDQLENTFSGAKVLKIDLYNPTTHQLLISTDAR